MAAANVSRLYGLKGYTSTVITACAAGNQAIGEATEAVRRGAADVILGGGCEAGICQLALGGFNVIKALTRSNDEPEKASRPFDAKARWLRARRGGGGVCDREPGARHRPRGERTGGGGRLRSVLGRLSRRSAGRGWGRRGARDALGAGERGRGYRRGRLHQRPRHVNAQERLRRDARNQVAFWRTRLQRGPSARPSR